MTDRNETLNRLIEAARCLGATQARQIYGQYTIADGQVEGGLHKKIDQYRAALAQPEHTPRQLSRLHQEAWNGVQDAYRDDPEVCFALGFDAGYGAVAQKVEPPKGECGGFDSRPAPLAQPEHEAWAYDMIDRFLRNNLYDDDYAEYVGALDSLCSPPPPRKEWVGLTSEELATIVVQHAGFPTRQAEAINAKLKELNG